MYDREESVRLNKIGLEYKRKGDFNSAIHYYEEAKKHDPTNKNCYLNCYKIYLGFGKLEALENMLIFKHLDFFDSNNIETLKLSQVTNWQEMYKWDEQIDSENNISADYVLKTTEKHPFLSLLAFDINTCLMLVFLSF